MDKKPLIAVSICAVVLLVLGPLSNVVGYQSVKSTVNDSPLFKIRTQRETNQRQNTLTSQYLGKGINALSFPLRDTTTEMIQKFIDKIRTMDDVTFNRFIDYAVRLLSQQEKIKDIDAKNIAKELTEIRGKPKVFQKYVYINDWNLTWKETPSLCWFPGCILGAILVMTIFILVFILVPTSAPTCDPYQCHPLNQ